MDENTAGMKNSDCEDVGEFHLGGVGRLKLGKMDDFDGC